MANIRRILAIDTSSQACSVALWQGVNWQAGHCVSQFRIAPRQHLQILLPMIKALLAEAQVALTEIDVFAFARGPGSFTGLRISASFIQALAFVQQKPVLAISSLSALAYKAWRQYQASAIVAALDARMQEIYVAAFTIQQLTQGAILFPIDAEQVIAPCQYQLPANELDFQGIGAGMQYSQQFTATVKQRLSVLDDVLEPDAYDVAWLAAYDYFYQDHLLAPIDAQPIYLRNEVAKPSVRGFNC